MNWQKGKIVCFVGSWKSGIAQLIIEKPNHTVELIPCDNAPTARTLDAMFDCIEPGHCIDNSKISGQKIRYLTDELGILTELAFPE